MTDAATFPPRKLDDLRMYWDWLQYFAARPGAAEHYRWAVGVVLESSLPVLVHGRDRRQPGPRCAGRLSRTANT